MFGMPFLEKFSRGACPWTPLVSAGCDVPNLAFQMLASMDKALAQYLMVVPHYSITLDPYC